MDISSYTHRKPNINDASAEDIAAVSGFGKHLSQLVSNHAPFGHWDHIKSLKGIGEKRLSSLKDHFDLWAGARSHWMNTFDSFRVGEEIEQDNFIRTHQPSPEQYYQHGRLEITRPSLLSLLTWKDSYDLTRAQKAFLEEVEGNTSLIFSGTAVLLKSRNEVGMYSHALTAAHCVDTLVSCTKLINKLSSIRDYKPKRGRITPQRQELLEFVCSELEHLLENSKNGYGYIDLGHPASQIFYLCANGDGNYQARVAIQNFEIHPYWKTEDSGYFDIAVLQFAASICANGNPMVLANICGSRKDLDLVSNIEVFGYLTPDFLHVSHDGSGASCDNNTLIRGDICHCVQTEHPFPATDAKLLGNVIVIRGEVAFGHSGTQAIIRTKDNIPVGIGVVSRLSASKSLSNSWFGDEFIENVRHADTIVTAYSDYTIQWIKDSLQRQNAATCPEVYTLSALELAALVDL